MSRFLPSRLAVDTTAPWYYANHVLPHTIYRLSDAEGRLLYIGCTKDYSTRIRSHRKKPWGRDIRRVTFETVAGSIDAFLMERAAIQAERPLYNFAHNRRDAA